MRLALVPLVVIGLHAPFAYAQTPLSLQDAVDRALAAHPLLSAAQERIAGQEGLRTQASLKPNPRLILQTENLRTYGNPGFRVFNDTDNFAYLSYNVETAGKRLNRTDLATQVVERTQLERDQLRQQIGHAVKQAYWAAAGSQRLLELLEENRKTFQQVVEYHEIRVREGAMAEVDLIRVRLEAERLQIAVNNAALEANRARIELFRRMGQSDFPQVRFTNVVEEPIATEPKVDMAAALERRPEMKLSRHLIGQATANQKLQLSLAKPDLEVFGGYKRTGGLNTAMGGVQVNLPINNANQGNIAAAASDIRFAETSLSATRALVEAEVRAAEADYRLRKQQVTTSLQPLRDQAAETYRIAVAAYREGGTDLLRLLDAQRLQSEILVLYYQTLMQYKQSVVALDAALGVAP